MTVVKTQRTKKQIGAEIKRLRKSYNMTQVKLGMILNIDSTKISKIESGTESSLEAFLLMEICEIFDTSLYLRTSGKLVQLVRTSVSKTECRGFESFTSC